VVKVGPVTVPIIDDDDPRFDEERSAWSAARSRAAAMHSADELLAGVEHDDWRVRHSAIPRLAARARDDERTPPALIRRLEADPAWEVRDLAAMTLVEFQSRPVADALIAAENDPHPEVRWSVQFSLSQFGLRTPPNDS
jgi:HEAT repeat protein